MKPYPRSGAGGNKMDEVVVEIMDEFFAYDENLPLDAVEKPIESDAGEPRRFHVTFTSARDERVPALLVLPADAAPPHPVVLILHGVFGYKSSPNQIKRSDALVAAGYATLRIDGKYRGEREAGAAGGLGLQTAYFYRNRDAMIQTVVDLMRGVDYLASRNDIDVERVGFTGFSMGGAIGAIFCAIDERVEAAVLGITGGDFDKLNIRAGATGEERLRRAYMIMDPVNFVSRISPRPLLMINGAKDEIVPKAATEALYEAAREPKRIIWYDCGHIDLPDEYLDEMTGFFDAELE